MRRFTRSYRTRKNISHTSALQEQFLRQLAQEADALLKQFSEQFNQTLQTQMTQLYQGIVPGDQASSAAAAGGELNSISSISQLLATGARYLVSRPRVSHDTVESRRSVDAGTQFQLSQSQAALEAQQALGNGDKNA